MFAVTTHSPHQPSALGTPHAILSSQLDQRSIRRTRPSSFSITRLGTEAHFSAGGIEDHLASVFRIRRGLCQER